LTLFLGTTRHPGTEVRPFRTLRTAVSVLTPGATLHVKGGTYSEALIASSPAMADADPAQSFFWYCAAGPSASAGPLIHAGPLKSLINAGLVR
jgi:hypothetical protein